MRKRKATSEGIFPRLKKEVAHSLLPLAKRIELQFSEAAHTFSHLGVLFIAFIIVLLMFVWKEGRGGTPYTPDDLSIKMQPEVTDVPAADVGIRMLLDQAQGEAGISSREGSMKTHTATSESSLQALPKLDLKGPWVCTSQSSKGKIEVYVKNKQVKSIMSDQSQTKNSLVTGDCIYEWSGREGTKQCGVSQYLDMIDTFASSGIVDIQSILLNQLGESSDNPDAYALLESCKSTAVADSHFVVPQGVDWIEPQNAISPPPSESTFMDMFGGF